MNEPMDIAEIESAYARCRDFLLAERNAAGHWVGELSTSALSTATAISGLHQMRQNGGLDDLNVADVSTGQNAEDEPVSIEDLVDQGIRRGCKWLLAHQNADGGFGDTNRSHSNIATTYLVLAAWEMTGFAKEHVQSTRDAWGYVESQGSWDGLRRRYGKDKTFVVPIMSNCALAGLIEWKEIPVLPFEAAWLPQDWYRLAKMPVVSYAVPALVAIGQALHHHAPTRNPLMRGLRNRAKQPTLEVLRRMQPASGGYLEATPLTSFVLMNIAGIGHAKLPVARDCLRFLLDSVLPDGSWPIDTNLATWVTGLSIVSLGRRQQLDIQIGARGGSQSTVEVDHRTVRWLLDCQHKGRHPFTGANPGGWGWTDLSGAVPDADDTPGAILALRQLDLSQPEHARMRHEVLAAIGAGLAWLCQLQNRDGGMPTFCRGWGQLPFDRSGTDLTAHALRAVNACLPDLAEIQRCAGTTEFGKKVPGLRRLNRLVSRGRAYIERQQSQDGSWLPLWFGNQDRAEEDNPIYGTSKVLMAYAELGWVGSPAAQKAIDYLRLSQNADGGWGGGPSVRYPTVSQVNPLAKPTYDESTNRAHNAGSAGSTIEETALGLEALVMCDKQSASRVVDDPTIMFGVKWLSERANPENLATSWPIGFYFAKLWYHERLYPSIFSLGALGAFLREVERSS